MRRLSFRQPESYSDSGEGKVLSDCTELVGRKEAIRLIDEQIGLHGEAISRHLAQYDARGALPTWHGIIRDIEEFINVVLYSDIDDEKSLRLMHLPVGGLVADPNVPLLARDLVAPYYGEALAKRFMITMLRVTRARPIRGPSVHFVTGPAVSDAVRKAVFAWRKAVFAWR